MTDYDSYFTNGDKPFAENINDALLLSNMFDLNVDINLPELYNNNTWSLSTGNRKAGVAITNVKEATGLSVTTVDDESAITGTGTLKLGFYPNFNAYGGIDKISWTGTGTITCSIYSANGSLITDVVNGEPITSTTALRTLQNFELRFTFTSATMLTLKVEMSNKEHTRYGAKIGINDVSELDDTLIGLQTDITTAQTDVDNLKKNDTAWTDCSISTAFKIGDGYLQSMIRNGFAVIRFNITFKISDVNSGVNMFTIDFGKFNPSSTLEVVVNMYSTTSGDRVGVAYITPQTGFTRVQLMGDMSGIVANQTGVTGVLIYPIADY